MRHHRRAGGWNDRSWSSLNEDCPLTVYITDGEATHAYLITSTYVLGTVFTVQMTVSAGVIRYIFNDQILPYSQKKSGSGWYFKVDDYTQSNPSTAKDASDAYAEVHVYDVKVTHSK